MTKDEIKNTPELVDYLLDESVIADSRKKLHKRMDEICNLAIQALEQEPKSEWEHDHEILKAYSDGVNEVLDKIKDEIKDNTYFINETTEKEGIDFETVKKIIDKYKAEREG